MVNLCDKIARAKGSVIILLKKKGFLAIITGIVMLAISVIPTTDLIKFEGGQVYFNREERQFALKAGDPADLGFVERKIESRQDKLKKAREVKKISRAKANRVKMMPFEKNIFTAAEYDLMLKGTGLAGCGKYFKKMEDKYKVNALFAIGVAMHESALGRKPIRNHNYFGMIGMSFKSKGDNIMYFGKLLSGGLYKGSGKRTIKEIGSRYAADVNWPARVTAHMVERVSVSK